MSIVLNVSASDDSCTNPNSSFDESVQSIIRARLVSTLTCTMLRIYGYSF